MCSIYLTDADLDTLNLSATIGLDPSAVGRVRLAIGEGLVGAVAELGEPIAAGEAQNHPRFKYIPETGEERYASLLAAPLLVQGATVGVLAIQNVDRRDFDRADIDLLQTCAQLLAPVVMNAQLLALMSDTPERRADLVATLAASGAVGISSEVPHRVGTHVELRGIATSRGVAIGPVYRIDDPVDLERIDYVPQGTPEGERADLRTALGEARREIEENREKVGERFGPEFAAIFHTQIQILEDKGFVQNLEQHVMREGNAVVALRAVLDSYLKTFEQIEDDYFRERGIDIIDVGQRIMENLLGVRSEHTPMGPGAVVVVDQVLAGLFARLEVDQVAAIVSEHGGSTSHGAIFARTLEIPAVTGVTEMMAEARNGETCIVDGTTGRIYLSPDETLLRYYEQAQHNYEIAVEHLDAMRGQPSETRDGRRVMLSANVGLLNDLRQAEQHGAEGIGLFRTELLALVHRGYPSEEEQVQLYRRVVERMADRPVTIRTLDLGGDKGIATVGIQGEENPQLGLRSIRLSLENRRAFRTQLRAILKASDGRHVKLLLPMISSVEELREARSLIEETRQSLEREGTPFDRSLPVGAMIEVPAAAISAEALAAECEFLSIGTNDLTQYTLAVDRGNERVAHLYDSLHPAVLALIERSVKAANQAGIPISVCGEMASNPLAVPILVGLGIGELSVVPAAVPVVKEIVRALDYREVAEDARRALSCVSPLEVHGIATDRLRGAGLLDHMDIGSWLREVVDDQPQPI